MHFSIHINDLRSAIIFLAMITILLIVRYVTSSETKNKKNESDENERISRFRKTPRF